MSNKRRRMRLHALPERRQVHRPGERLRLQLHRRLDGRHLRNPLRRVQVKVVREQRHLHDVGQQTRIHLCLC